MDLYRINQLNDSTFGSLFDFGRGGDWVRAHASAYERMYLILNFCITDDVIQKNPS